MGNPLASKTVSTRDAIRARIQARAAANVAVQKTKTAAKKYATLRRIAFEEPQEVGSALTQLADGFAELSAALHTFLQNLDLNSGAGLPVAASLKARIAQRRNYANRFRRVAEEVPAEFEGAFGELYQALDGMAEDMENAADNMGIALPTVTDGGETEPAEVAEGEHEVVEEAQDVGLPVPEDVEEHVEEHEASSGSDWFVTDRDTEGKPKAPQTASARKSIVQAR